jgi:hypothetical protein
VEWLRVTLEIYRRVASRAAVLALRNWPVLGSLFAYALIVEVVGGFALHLGIIGGLLYSLVLSACIGSFLYLVEMMVRTSRVAWEDFGRSFTVYLWDVVGVVFILWLLSLVTSLALAQTPQGAVIGLCLQILVLVFFNAVPELIYLGHHGSVALLSESYRFIGDNWIEWFPPNIALIAALLSLGMVEVHGTVAAVLKVAVLALFVYFAMVLRGLLFIELYGTSRRSRAFRHRTGR